ncbi:hypothetical protein GN316_15070 [Xylophilus sp. Kf1]|nr:hypothetical protein [Xylophilus sp. Kf1]
MKHSWLLAAALLATTGPTMAQARISITSGWANVEATLVDNAATRALLTMLPVTLQMRDHMRQEKTGQLPASLPAAPRQRGFSVGTLGLWGADDFVVYYAKGQVPLPGIVVLGTVEGDVSAFDHPDAGEITIRRIR